MKKFLWVISNIWGLFLNPSSADNMYSLLKRGNFLQHFQRNLCQKRKILSEFFLTFSKFRWNFELFQKGDPHSWCVLDFTDSNCLLTHWLLMTRILFLTEAVYCKFSHTIISETKNFLWYFFFSFSKFRFNFQNFQKKDHPDSWRVFELTGSERCG